MFLSWLENGEPVSNSADYSFTSTTSRVLVANFIAQPGLVSTMAVPGVVTVSWPAGAIGWVLEESPDLSPGSWVDSTRPVTVVGSLKQVSIPQTNGRGFFRLIYP